MRTAVTAILIATAATAAGCGGSSSSSSSPAPATTAASTAPAPSAQVSPAPTRTSRAHTHSNATPTAPVTHRTHPAPARHRPAGAAARPGATAPSPSRGSRTAPGVKAVPPHLVGRSLEVAMTLLRNAGIPYKVIPLHGHTTPSTSSWGVCEMTPVATPSITGATQVGLIVAHMRCGAH